MRDNRNIPDEANRYDGAPAPDPAPAPAPSQAEIAAEQRSALREAGCEDCDETDPDNLEFYLPSATGARGYRSEIEETVLCDSCASDREDN